MSTAVYYRHKTLHVFLSYYHLCRRGAHGFGIWEQTTKPNGALPLELDPTVGLPSPDPTGCPRLTMPLSKPRTTLFGKSPYMYGWLAAGCGNKAQ